jgi:hypothetical protein
MATPWGWPLSDSKQEAALTDLLRSTPVRDICGGPDFVAVLMENSTVNLFGNLTDIAAIPPFTSQPVAITCGWKHIVRHGNQKCLL